MGITAEQVREIQKRAIQTLETLKDYNLTPDTAARYALADGVLRVLTGKPAPHIISGGRSPQRQRELLQMWERGDAGVVYKPARYSWHTVGRAIDVERRDENFAYLWELFGGRDGKRFDDPRHFDLPNATLPPAAW